MHGRLAIVRAVRRFSALKNDQVRYNPFNIQLLPKALRDKVFPAGTNDCPPEIIGIAEEHLRRHSIPFDQPRPPAPVLPEKFVNAIPELMGKDIAEHFYKLGVFGSQDWKALADTASQMNIPKRPEKFCEQPGWTFYPEDESFKHMGSEHPRDQILMLDTESSWTLSRYPLFAVALGQSGWYSWTSPAVASKADLSQLIPLGLPNDPQLVIGHHVSFDRGQILEEYDLRLSKRRFLDTMSLHCAIAGLSSQQRPLWNKNRKDAEDPCRSEDLNHESPWLQHGAMNSLVDAVKLHCNVDLDKSDLELLIDATWDSIYENRQKILQYCSRDVEATAMLYKAVWGRFCEYCPHPVTLAGILAMGSMILPVDSSWGRYISKCETGYKESLEESSGLLSQLAESTSLLPVDSVNKDPWLSQIDWSPVPFKYSSVKKKPIGDERLFGRPEWYKKHFDRQLGRCLVTTKSAITPILLKLSWNGRPVYLKKGDGWCYLVPLAEKAKFSQSNGEKGLLDATITIDNVEYALFKVPHASEEGSNVGCLISKGYLKAIESGVLKSEFPEVLSKIFASSTRWSFWTGYRERLAQQLVHFPDKDRDLGFIIPATVTMGTVTRRAVENTWMTASNPKKNSAGSEQKAMVRAPPGWSFVGADVDSQELWIASLLGDSWFGEHGATAMGWMTLQGSRHDSTDLHSRTAAILGMKRDDAKIFTYGRIYGAGMKYAASLLTKFNPLMSSNEAKSKAEDLYLKTKGRRSPRSNLLFGGSESYMFNQLEKIATDSVKASTPILGCRISESLSKVNVGREYMTSRVNWAVQSSAVDYLHLMLAAMNFLIQAYKIPARLAITIHDELRFLVEEGHETRAALALQISNFWVRSMFAHRVNIFDLPNSVAFFSLVDIDKILRKEPSLNCITPTNDTALPSGYSLTIFDLAEMSLESADQSVCELVRNIKPPRNEIAFQPHPSKRNMWKDILLRQMVEWADTEKKQSPIFSKMSDIVKGLDIKQEHSHKSVF